MTNVKPIHEIKLGRLRAAVWSNPVESGTMNSVTFSRLYKDEKTDKWADSSSFGRDDLLVLSKLCDQAHTWILQQKAREKEVEVTPVN